MEYENLTEALRNVRLSSKEVYDNGRREFIKRQEDAFDPEALRALLAIRPGHAFQATIVLREDFDLINGILTVAGHVVVPRSRHYQEVASLIRAMLPDENACGVLDGFVAEGSYIYTQPSVNQWNPVLATTTFFRTPNYNSDSGSGQPTSPGTTDSTGSITVSLACL